MGTQIPPASIVTKVWVLGVYNNAAVCSFARVSCPNWQNPVLAKNRIARTYDTIR